MWDSRLSSAYAPRADPMTKTSFDVLGRGDSPHEGIAVPGTCFSSVQMAGVGVKLFGGESLLSEVTVIGICVSSIGLPMSFSTVPLYA